MPRRNPRKPAAALSAAAADIDIREAGFTLLETLIALTVAAILSIGLVQFMGSTHLIAAHADQKFAVAALETAVMAALPEPAHLRAFRRSGSRGDLDWELSAAPMPERAQAAASAAGSDDAASGGAVAPEASVSPSNWRRYAVTIDIRSHGSVVDHVEMVRIGSGVSGDAGSPP